ncbi:glycine cleavage system P-protein-domain-containing protein [Polychytrium aggregatum]|uniref:glycine cleavage system P-protein-domain-containing protein n=1 Tax=Polychytrium aggregatum TaxID=110093 RepID=UPI0022FF0761|nr:glycine cleavage system P-protein-domain-containing protein [Polychytrium aggregatum]KAI9197243.1 glycine cleavage system P-protein-domain-containing protein [Polychytrium aggregatum]
MFAAATIRAARYASAAPLIAARSASRHLVRSVTARSSPVLSASFSSAARLHSADVFAPRDSFPRRHIGPNDSDVAEMCKVVGVKDLADLVNKTVPEAIHVVKGTKLGPAVPETETLAILREIASKNKIFKSYIGMGYYSSITPPVILRNIMENPGWYTQYTPYQPEISQGRLESLMNWQTMVQDMTGLPIANASLLDEGTAAAEAMLMCFGQANHKKNIFFVDRACHPQTISCVKTRAEGFGIQVVVGDYETLNFDEYKGNLMGVLIQYPTTDGRVLDYETFTKKAHEHKALVTCATDLMSLALLKPPGEFGVDIAFGNSQRFGVPLGYGGPHAAFLAVRDEYKRRMPGRLIGLSKDTEDRQAYRLSLQTREQHIRREKATSNICTAQALLANMAAMYAVYHGPTGIREIAQRIHNLTGVFAESVRRLGHTVETESFFDTVTVRVQGGSDAIVRRAAAAGINLRPVDEHRVGVSLDETVTKGDLEALVSVFGDKTIDIEAVAADLKLTPSSGAFFATQLTRQSAYLKHPIFNIYHSETDMLRYITHLQKKDLSLGDAMIPLGSCTMKLNATTEMIPVTWPEFGALHPFVPADQAEGYKIMHEQLQDALAQATGFDTISLQPNSGAQGEYAGLRVIKKYLASIGQGHRDVVLIPVSAHGTNPASAAMCSLKVVTVKCDEKGYLDLDDLAAKAEKHKNNLAATMITYPSTYGVFEEGIKRACEIIHSHGGQVYMDGANLNAQMGLCNPAEIGADVCHLNLHKTFCIPHGGGGPGMGPIGVKSHLAPFLPSHPIVPTGGENGIGPVSAAPWGSASILPITWSYLKMMGDQGLKNATQVALLNANYMLKRLEPHYKILFVNKNGMCAHEFIVDCRPFANTSHIQGIDIAKRLLDYGFHSPTMSFPVANTLMIEPTESEPKAEIDRFINAMISIRNEIREIEEGRQPQTNNVLTNAPHTVEDLLKPEWDRPYSREQAAFPLPGLKKKKFWPTVSRVDDTYGDRNLICSCPPLEDYE